MMKKEVSFYKNSTKIKPLRKIWIYFIDMICLLIVSCLFFGISELISSSLDVINLKKNEMSIQKEELYNLVDDSKLDIYDKDNKSLKGSEYIIKNYMYSLVKESLEYNGLTNQAESSIYAGVSSLIPSNDNVYYYFVDFKNTNISSFNLTSNYDGYSYFINLSKENIEFDDVFEIRGELNYPFLKKDVAIMIHNYYGDNNYSLGLEKYELIYNYYSNFLSKGIADFTNNYIPYVELNNAFNNGATYLLSVKIYELFASYLLSSLILFLIFPLIFKDGKTLTFKIFSIGTCLLNGNSPNWVNYLIKCLCNLFEYLVVISLIGVVFFNGDIISLFSITLFRFFNLLTMSLFSIILIILSIIYMFINKNKQTISEFISNQLVKDGKEFNIVNKEIKDGRK